jgi:hypothetical protein
MDRWWQSLGELIAKRIALRWRSAREKRAVEAAIPLDEIGSGPPQAEGGDPRATSPNGGGNEPS